MSKKLFDALFNFFYSIHKNIIHFMLFLIVSIIIVIIFSSLNNNYVITSTFIVVLYPIELIASGLRNLSRSSDLGNSVALIIFTLMSLIPILYYLFFVIKYNNFNKFNLLLYILLSIFWGITLYLFINPSLIPNGFSYLDEHLKYSKEMVNQIQQIYKSSLVFTLLLFIMIFLSVKFYRYTQIRNINLFKLSTIFITILKVVYIGLMLIMFIILPSITINEINDVKTEALQSIQTESSDRVEDAFNPSEDLWFKGLDLEQDVRNPSNSYLNYQIINVLINAIFTYITLIIFVVILRKLYKLFINFNKEVLFTENNVLLLQSMSSLMALIMVNQFVYQFIKNSYQLIFISKLRRTDFLLQLPLLHIIVALAFYLFASIIKQSYKIYEENRLTI